MAKPLLLNTSTINLRGLLANGKRYEVPRFQRDYSWREEHWDDLWQDIVELESSGRPHYMGALVLQEERADEFSIIDGQQRIATLSILVVAALHCLRRLADEGVEPEANAKRMDLLRTAFLGAEHPATLVTTPKLALNRSNRRFYEGTLVALITPPSVPALPATERPLWDAMTYFRGKLEERFVGAQDGAGLANFIYETVATRLLFIQVVVEDEGGAYTVFETLNARGLELSAGDLLKNYLLSIVHTAGDGQLEHAMQKWQCITERVEPRRVPEFLRHHLNSTREYVRQERVYRTIRAEVSKPVQAVALLRELEDAALLNQALDDATHALWDEAPEVRKSVRALQIYQVAQFRPLAFAAWRRLGVTELVAVLRACDAVSFRYNVISQRNTNRLEQEYNRIAMGVSSGEFKSAADVRRELAAIYVQDDEFQQAFSKRSLPRAVQLIRYVLCAIERHEHGTNVAWDDGSLTVEHVLPVNPTAEWTQGFPGDLHERYVHRLGNCLLLEPKLNARAAANRPLGEKLAAYAKSTCHSTREFSASRWTPREIDARQEQMARVATAIWRL
ncbi:MAG: hypothetical protein HMLKMBBP_03664 [Planctomycetes bacterium]|nr:hypothetical protein [Planctomycetota bacterium]